MVTGPALIVIFFASIALVLLMIIRLKLNPFVALLIISLLTGFAVGMPEAEIRTAIATGFGNTLKGIGIVIGLGIILGKLLSESGATGQIAEGLIKITGKSKSPLAMAIAGYLVSIPVFMDAAFVILVSIIKKLPSLTKIPLIVYVTALSVGLITTHAMLIPTPGPVDVAESFRLQVGPFIFYSLVVSFPAALVGGWLYGEFLGKKEKGKQMADNEGISEVDERRPSVFTSFFVLLMPIILILLGSTFALILPEGHVLKSFFSFIGDKNIALLISVLIAIFILSKYFIKPPNQMIAEAADSAGLILLITGVGGAFGSIISASGIGAYLVSNLTALNFSLPLTGFILSALLRAALGSSTVALITTSSILAPMVGADSSMALQTAISVCAGGLCCSLPNDSGFWVVSRFSGISVSQTLKSWTVGGTIGGLVAYLITSLIFNILS